MSEPLRVIECGLLPYEEARSLQGQIAEARRRGEVPDTLLLLEHPPTYTRGRRSDPAELQMGTEWYEAQGIEVRDTDRGGRVTYHGPGQLVAYPVVELKPAASSASRPGAAGSRGYEVHAFVRLLERAMIGALAEYKIEAGTIDGLTGVWVAQPRGDPRKIGSIGIHVSRGVTTHGLAVNVNNDLQPFEWIVPCGIENVRMTSVSRELGSEQDLARFGEVVATRLAVELDRPLLPPSRSGQPVRVGALP
jgi:lipoyl(octanoyl) transferase